MREQWDHQVPVVQPVKGVNQEPLDHLVNQAQQDLGEHKVWLVSLELREWLDKRVKMDHLDDLVYLV